MNGMLLDVEVQRIYFGLATQAQKQIPGNLIRPKKSVIVIAGPTACGKSAFAVALAKSIGGEIISADSMQVYRGANIGTAKPTAEEQAAVPHHLIDVRNLDESFNVVDFFYEARHCCEVILSQNRVPIVVGGSGFYLHAFIYGPPSGPPSMPEVRQALEEELLQKGIEPLFERLRQQDPHYAATVNKNDRQKILRALEIMTLTRKRVSQLSWKRRTQAVNYDFHCWFLNRPREHLYRRIEKRCDKMLEEGFLDEVRQLDAEGALSKNTAAAQAIGYRQALEYLKTAGTEQDYQVFVNKFKQASRNYAKRQLTWFRREPLFRWLDLDLDYEIALDIVQQEYQGQ